MANGSTRYIITNDRIDHLQCTLRDIEPEITSLTEKFDEQDKLNLKIKSVLRTFLQISNTQYHINEVILQEFDDQHKINDIFKAEFENLKTRYEKLKLWMRILGITTAITLFITIIQWFI